MRVRRIPEDACPVRCPPMWGRLNGKTSSLHASDACLHEIRPCRPRGARQRGRLATCATRRRPAHGRATSFRDRNRVGSAAERARAARAHDVPSRRRDRRSCAARPLNVPWVTSRKDRNQCTDTRTLGGQILSRARAGFYLTPPHSVLEPKS